MHVIPKVQLGAVLLLFTLCWNACQQEGGSWPDTPLQLRISGTDIFEDTLKMHADARLDIPFEIHGGAGPVELSMSRLDGGLVTYDGLVLNNTTVLAEVRQGQLLFRPLEAGVHSFILNAMDASGASSTALIELAAMENQRPQASATATWVAEASPYHVRIDAGESLDADADWGGRVVAYEFDLIGFYKTVTTRSVLDYIYPEPRRYEISVRVQDNDEVWSDPVVVDVDVE